MATISFKIDDALFAELKQLAGERNCQSESILARQIVQDYLNDTERNRIREGITELNQSVQRQHHDLITAAYALLVKAGRCEPDQAKDWVEKHLAGPMSNGDD